MKKKLFSSGLLRSAAVLTAVCLVGLWLYLAARPEPVTVEQTTGDYMEYERAVVE